MHTLGEAAQRNLVEMNGSILFISSNDINPKRWNDSGY